jgi:N-acetylglucosamine kinase-like BadF-type ATPase
MILIADSGSTKTDWTMVHSAHPLLGCQVIATFHTQGITPIHQTAADIRRILEQELLSSISIFPRAQLINSGILEGSLLQKLDIFFYGSGCPPAHVPMMQQLLAEVLTPNSVEVHSDLMASARALCQHEAGIACILGTGANSCLFDGEKIVQNTPALGYILGDEGSGSVLGRMFLNAIFKRPELADVRDQYLQEHKFTQADVIQKVYREPMANRFLATTSLFIHEHLDNPLLRQLVVDNFRSFFQRNIAPYGRKDLHVHFVGSMAHHYPDELQEAAAKEGFTIGRTVQSPLEGLILYHSGAQKIIDMREEAR